MAFPKQDNAIQWVADRVANAKIFCRHASLYIRRASESIRVAFLCLLSLALGGRETLLERTCFSGGSEGVLENVGEDVFGFNFILGFQKAPNLEKAKDDSSGTSLTCRLCSVAFHQLSPPEALWELRLYAPVMVKTSIAPGMV